MDTDLYITDQSTEVLLEEGCMIEIRYDEEGIKFEVVEAPLEPSIGGFQPDISSSSIVNIVDSWRQGANVQELPVPPDPTPAEIARQRAEAAMRLYNNVQRHNHARGRVGTMDWGTHFLSRDLAELTIEKPSEGGVLSHPGSESVEIAHDGVSGENPTHQDPSYRAPTKRASQSKRPRRRHQRREVCKMESSPSQKRSGGTDKAKSPEQPAR